MSQLIKDLIGNYDYENFVIKIGSNLNVNRKDFKPNFDFIDDICFAAGILKTHYHKRVSLVVSGAIPLGSVFMNAVETPAKKKAAAGIGQPKLYHAFEEAFSRNDIQTGQILITHDEIKREQTRSELIDTTQTILDHGIIPIWNANDAIAVDELPHDGIKPDNDMLAARICTDIVDADVLLILSQNALYTGNPANDNSHTHIPCVDEITSFHRSIAGAEFSPLSTGGMAGKIKAIDFATSFGVHAAIINGLQPRSMMNILMERDGVESTYFRPKHVKNKTNPIESSQSLSL